MSTAQLPNQTLTRPGPPIPSPPSGRVEPVYDDQITEIVGRLQLHYPSEQISLADLERRVRSFHRQFNTARIRSFVAVLVEHLVRRSIEEPSASTPRVGVRPGALAPIFCWVDARRPRSLRPATAPPRSTWPGDSHVSPRGVPWTPGSAKACRRDSRPGPALHPSPPGPRGTTSDPRRFR
jgi:hypothetical protein